MFVPPEVKPNFSFFFADTHTRTHRHTVGQRHAHARTHSLTHAQQGEGQGSEKKNFFSPLVFGPIFFFFG